jgi:hypothetical protein
MHAPRRVDAGKVELDGAQYLGFSLPFSITQLVWIEAILVGGAEIYRNRELDTDARIYPGAPELGVSAVARSCLAPVCSGSLLRHCVCRRRPAARLSASAARQGATLTRWVLRAATTTARSSSRPPR